MRLIRHHASAWHIDPLRVGVAGFSAGGYPAAHACMRSGAPASGGAAAVADLIDRQPARPGEQGISHCSPLPLSARIQPLKPRYLRVFRLSDTGLSTPLGRRATTRFPTSAIDLRPRRPGRRNQRGCAGHWPRVGRQRLELWRAERDGGATVPAIQRGGCFRGAAHVRRRGAWLWPPSVSRRRSVPLAGENVGVAGRRVPTQT